MTEERRAELRSLFWSETNELESQTWREDLTAEERREVAQWDQQYDAAVETAEQKIAAAQKPTEPFYGQIDFLGRNGIIGESLYFTDRDEYLKEIHESREVGRPIDPREISGDEYIRGNLTEASEGKINDGYYVLDETPALAVGVDPFSLESKYRVWSTSLTPWGTLETKAELSAGDYQELADNGIDAEYIQSTMNHIDKVTAAYHNMKSPSKERKEDVRYFVLNDTIPAEGYTNEPMYDDSPDAASYQSDYGIPQPGKEDLLVYDPTSEKMFDFHSRDRDFAGVTFRPFDVNPYIQNGAMTEISQAAFDVYIEYNQRFFQDDLLTSIRDLSEQKSIAEYHISEIRAGISDQTFTEADLAAEENRLDDINDKIKQYHDRLLQWQSDRDAALAEASRTADAHQKDQQADGKAPEKEEQKKKPQDWYDRTLSDLQSDMFSDLRLSKLDRENGGKTIVLLSSPEVRSRLESYGIRIDQFDIKQLSVIADMVANGLVIYSGNSVLVSGVTAAEMREIANPKLTQKEMLAIRSRMIKEKLENGLFLSPSVVQLERLKNRPNLEAVKETEQSTQGAEDETKLITFDDAGYDLGNTRNEKQAFLYLQIGVPVGARLMADEQNNIIGKYDEPQGEVRDVFLPLQDEQELAVYGRRYFCHYIIDPRVMTAEQAQHFNYVFDMLTDRSLHSIEEINAIEKRMLSEKPVGYEKMMALRDRYLTDEKVNQIVSNTKAARETILRFMGKGENKTVGAQHANQPSSGRREENAADRNTNKAVQQPPIDKKRSFTRDQLERAKQADLLSYLSGRYELERHGGRNYRMKEHESLVIFPDTNSWYWFSRKEGGNILDFLTKYEGKNLVDAVYELLGERFDPQKMFQKEQAQENGPLALPGKADTNRHVFAYLTKTRGLDPAVVNGCLNDGSIYEGVNVVKRPGKDLTFYNCVFVGRDTDGNPAWASQRSTNDKMSFRGDAANSRKEFAFRLEARESAHWVNVFEAPIDAMSYATLQKRGGADYGLEHHVSLGGLSDRALEQFLKTHPEVNTINLCLDNDKPGRMASAAIAQKYQDQGYTVLESCPEHKDYNDDLKAELAADNQPLIDLPEKAQDNRRVFAHLAKDAAVNSDLINRYMTQGILYQTEQTVERDGQVKRYASAVYLGRDEDGNPDYAMRVSLYRSPENGYFKMEYKDPVEGGCISLPGENSSLLVFNNPVSMLTQQSMMLEAGKENKNHYLCALTGLPGEVERYVQKHPQINEVKLMLDKTVGISRKTNQPVDYRELNARKVKDVLKGRNIQVVTKFPQGLDLNQDYLKGKGLSKANGIQKGQNKGKELER